METDFEGWDDIDICKICKTDLNMIHMVDFEIDDSIGDHIMFCANCNAVRTWDMHYNDVWHFEYPSPLRRAHKLN